jgi:uncharacterized protein (DUF4415 family)
MSKKTAELELADLPSDVSSLKGWSRASRTADLGAVKVPTRRVTMNLDSDIVAAFKAEALRGGAPYQVAINQALRRYLRQQEEGGNERAVASVLAALDDPLVQRKIRALSALRNSRRARRGA